ncbi:MAG: beta-galactosidase [Armatimonadota bacterium]|nr:beta-galactosidase [Armatimonadota bacterium]
MRLLVAPIVALGLPTLLSASVKAPVVNPGFEEVVANNDAPGWAWYTRASAGFRASTENPHSGARCLVFWNESSLAPEVYGRLYQGVKVYACTEYELSIWVRGTDVSPGNHLTDWSNYMLSLPSGTFDWTKVSTRFRTAPGQTGLNLGVNIVNKCRELAIDDIELRPVGLPIEGPGISGYLFIPGRIDGDDQLSYVALELTSNVSGLATARISAAGEELFLQNARFKKGTSSFEWQWSSGKAAHRVLNCEVVLKPDTEKTICISRQIEKVSPAVVLADIDRVEQRLSELKSLISLCKNKGLPTDYEDAVAVMLEQFIPLARSDAAGSEIRRADFSVRDFDCALNESTAKLRAYLSNPKLAPRPIRYVSGHVRVNRLIFEGSKRDWKGRPSQGPVYFCGYGHFTQVRKDIPLFRRYGVNIIQIEIGPAAVFPSEHEVCLEPVNEIARVLDRAALYDVAVNVLLSPHYFPAWAAAKWPHLVKGGGGFLGYCVDEPQAKAIVERFIRTVVPRIRSKRALHSICLSNEPIFDRGASCENTRALWERYLADVHGSVGQMNKRYGTNYSSFAEVPIPANDAYAAPQYYDWCIFNQERFASWHKWMADVIHEIAPEIPVHAKMMWIPISWRQAAAWGIDPELFAQFCEINGNDCVIWPGSGEWGISWLEQNMFYDLQRSMAPKPIFNSENHLQPDGSTSYVPPEHYRCALWQGAVHGQGATTIWVWERTKDPSDPAYASTLPFYGNVMDRPGCALAVGTTCLDLNRFAEEVAALQTTQAPVALLYSMSSYVRNDTYLDILRRAYTALNFCGVKIDFISDKQVAAGKARLYKLIVAAGATHVPDSTVDNLARLPRTSRIVVVGEDTFAYDQYCRKRSNKQREELLARCTVIQAQADPKNDLWPAFQEELSKAGALPRVRVVDAKTEQPIWGVEWLPTICKGKMVLNMVNLTNTSVDVKVLLEGKPVHARDLLSLGGQELVRTLRPITPVLAAVD